MTTTEQYEAAIVEAVEAFRIEYSHPARLNRLGASNWKEALVCCWHSGEDANFKTADGAHHGGTLRQLRNDPHRNTRWLDDYQPKPLLGHIFKSRLGGWGVYLTTTADLSGAGTPAGIHSTKAAAKAHVKNAGATPHNF